MSGQERAKTDSRLSKRFVLMGIVAVCAGGALAWVLCAKQLSLLVDRFHTARVSTLAVHPLSFTQGTLWFAGDPLELIPNRAHEKINIYSNSQNAVMLTIGTSSFPLGKVTRAPIKGDSACLFEPGPGDQVAITTDNSIISWPTPLETNFITGQAPSWKRHMYYRLVWKKPSGAELNMVWRYEQPFYDALGWASGTMVNEDSTGLIEARSTMDVSSEKIEYETEIVDYIKRTKEWKRDQYRIENRGQSADGKIFNSAVIYLADETSPAPGAGKSVVLQIDCDSHKIVKELGGQ